jgi:hypothetical protein
MFSQVDWLIPKATLSVGNCIARIPLGGSTCEAPVTWAIDNATSPRVRNITTSDDYSTATSGTGVNQTLRLGVNTIQALDGSTMLRAVNVTVDNCAVGLGVYGGTCEVPPPVITITSNKTIVRKGDTATIGWTMTPSPLTAGSCTISGPGLSGTVTSSESRISAPLANKSQFKITCNVAPHAPITETVDVELIPSSQEV